MTNTVAGIHLGIDTHANRPAAGDVTAGTLYSCTDHSLIYRSDGATWATWATLGGGGGGGEGEYTDWTPALTAASTNPTLGTGSTTEGRFTQIGDLIVAHGIIQFGTSGVAGGSGNYQISHPADALEDGLQNFVRGHGYVFDDSTGAVRAIVATRVSATVAQLLLPHATTNNFVTPTVPWTWAANDAILFSLTYEAAAA